MFHDIMLSLNKQQEKWQTVRTKGEKLAFVGLHGGNAPIRLGSSIWFAQSNGMVQYHPDSDECSQAVRYPLNFIPVGNDGSCTACKYRDDFIFVVNSYKRCCIVFETKTRSFSDTILFPLTFDDCSSPCVAIGDYIHIPNWKLIGNYDHDDEYVIYSMTHIPVHIINGHSCASTYSESSIIKTNDLYKSSSKTLVSGFARSQSGRHIPSVIIDLISK